MLKIETDNYLKLIVCGRYIFKEYVTIATSKRKFHPYVTITLDFFSLHMEMCLSYAKTFNYIFCFCCWYFKHFHYQLHFELWESWSLRRRCVILATLFYYASTLRYARVPIIFLIINGLSSWNKFNRQCTAGQEIEIQWISRHHAGKL